MSSQEDEPTFGSAQKKRRGPACDKCRSKKVRCDGRPGERCTNCTTGKQECTYISTARKRYPDVARIEELETQLSNMKKLLNKLHPGVDFTPALNGYVDDNSLWMLNTSDPKFKSDTRPKPGVDSSLPLPLPQPTLVIDDIGPEGLDPSDDEFSAPSLLERSFKAMSLHTGPPRFLGKSSRFAFFKKVFNYKYEQAGVEPPNFFNKIAETIARKRTELFLNQPWVIPILQLSEPPHTSFPEPDLMASLVDIYFERNNVWLPLLHRPTFEEQLKSSLHLADEGFGSVLLLVCAVASRLSDDPRVLYEGSESWHSAGAKWFQQVQASLRVMNLRPPRLYDIQICCLAASFLHGSPINQPAWSLVGYGLRIAQELGAHRRRRYGPTPTVEGELMKRAFWVLMALDRAMSSSLGRTCVLQDEDFDVDALTEVDDEYWMDAESNPVFKQPAGKPSRIAFFNCFLKIKQIHAFTLRTVYAINRSKVAFGRQGPEWEQDMVSEIDSALNAWKDSVPEHLQWDPHREDLLFFNQSAFLWCAFYSLQINVHRSFIPSPGKGSLNALPSLTICTNAARSSMHILDVQYSREGNIHTGSSPQNALFTAAIVLLLSAWGSSNRGNELSKDMLEVHKAMRMLRQLGKRWFSASRYCEILYDLANVGDLPLPNTPPSAPPSGQKRSRSLERETSTPETVDSPMSDRPVAGNKRMQAYQQTHRSPEPIAQAEPLVVSKTSPIPSMSTPFDLTGLPSLSAASGMWPSSSSITQAYLEAPQPTLYSSVSSPASTFEYDLTGTSVQAFLSSPPEQAYIPDMSATNLHVGPAVMGSISAGGLQAGPQAAVPALQPAFLPFDGVPDSDVLAMWSMAPSGFEWVDWGMYASNMTELAGGDPSQQ